jgi:two-component system, OmpR family, phosphate regulon sensor histidine kinase PhoR
MQAKEKNRLIIVTGILSAAFVALIVVLIVLIMNVTEVNRLVFSNNVVSGLREAKTQFFKQNLYKNEIESMMQSHDEAIKIKLDTDIQAHIKTAFKNYSLDLAFEYGLYSHVDHHLPLVYQFGNFKRTVQLDSCNNFFSKKNNYYQTSFLEAEDESEPHSHLVLYFPKQDQFLISQLYGIIVICFLLALVLLFSFFFFIKKIIHQKRLAEIKNDFINNLTHEFKTPLFSIGLASNLLKKNEHIKDSPPLLKLIGSIESENTRLKNQVDKILQVALLDSDNFLLEKKVVDVNKMIQEVLQSFQLRIAETAAVIKTDLCATNSLCDVDELHLKNALYNLVDNALKYCEKQPEIVITTHNETKETPSICVVIKDNGIGMNKTVQEKVFDKFYRVERGNIHTVKGFGLGLSYVKDIIAAHKGSIYLESELGRGSKFTIALPLMKDEYQ